MPKVIIEISLSWLLFFFMISKQSVSSLQILCVSSTVTAVKEYLYTSAVLVACVVSSYFSPLLVSIIFFISPQKADLTTTFSFSCCIYEVLPLHVLGNPIHVSSYLFPLRNLISPSDTIFHFLELRYCIHSECLLINPWIS